MAFLLPPICQSCSFTWLTQLKLDGGSGSHCPPNFWLDSGPVWCGLCSNLSSGPNYDSTSLVMLIWKATTGTPIGKPASFREDPTSIWLSHDGMWLFYCPGGTQSQVVMMWDIGSGLATHLKLRSHDVQALAFLYHGNNIFTHSDQACIWDLITGNIITSDTAQVILQWP